MQTTTTRRATKITSLLLAIVMLLSTFGGLNLTAFASQGYLVDKVTCRVTWDEAYEYKMSDAAYLEGTGRYKAYLIRFSSPDAAFDFSVFPIDTGKSNISGVTSYDYYLETDQTERISISASDFNEEPIRVTMEIYDITGTPKKSAVKKLSAKKKQMKIKMKKVAGVTGYQIQYSRNSKFKNAKKITVKGAKNTSKTIKKLKRHTKYYVRVRTYKSAGGRKYISEWSKAKIVKTK